MFWSSYEIIILWNKVSNGNSNNENRTGLVEVVDDHLVISNKWQAGLSD
jgi:hypothetical protein